ncbi:hypothetical protein ACST14_07090 [Aquirufa sp. A-Brett2-15D]
MKKILFFIFLGLSIHSAHSQTVQNFKVKNASNEKDRTMMLDILRADLYQNVKQELIFVVDHFKVAGNYAWFEGKAQRKDGRQIRFPAEGEYDCCLTTALFKKSNGKWYIVESGAFGTDCWHCAIAYRHPYAPKIIFSQTARGN